jgi:beta-xylosidase
VREAPTHWSLTAHPGTLRIITQAGGIFGNYYDPEKNILVTGAPLGDFQITTKVAITPTQNFQTAGILYYQDDDNFLNLVYLYDTDGTWVIFHKEINGIVSFNIYPDHVSMSPLYLRIDRHDTTYTGYFSANGNDWTKVGDQTITLINPKVGLGACNGPSGVPEISADFDFFLVSSASRLFLPLILR